MYFIVDRIEGGFAVVETAPDRSCSVPLSALPPGVRESDVIRVSVSRARTRRMRRAAMKKALRLSQKR